MSSAKQEARDDPASRVLEVKVSPEGLRNTAHGRARPCIISDSQTSSGPSALAQTPHPIWVCPCTHVKGI